MESQRGSKKRNRGRTYKIFIRANPMGWLFLFTGSKFVANTNFEELSWIFINIREQEMTS